MKVFAYYVAAAGDNLATKGKLDHDWNSAQFFWSDLPQAEKDAALQKVLNSSDFDEGVFVPNKDLFAQLNDLAYNATAGGPGPDKREVGEIFDQVGQILMES